MSATGAHAGLGRRLGAMLYDGLLLAAVLFAAAAVFLGAAVALTGQSAAITAGSPLRHPLQAWLVLVLYAYFGWFWTRAGFTPGMRAWRIKVVAMDGRRIGWSAAALRCAAALLSLLALGGGYLWMLVDREGLTWHDRLSATRVVRAAELD